MTIREYTGKTTQEAIDTGLAELGVTIADVHVDVLQEGAKGLFGLFGSRPAKVRITVMEDEKEETGLGIRWSIEEEKPRKKEKKPQQEAKKAEAASVQKPQTEAEKKPQQEEKKEKVQPQKKPKAQQEEKKAKPADEAAAEPAAAEKQENAAAEVMADEGAQKKKPKGKKANAPREKAEKPREAMIPAEVFQPSEPPVLYPEDSAAGIAQRFLTELTEKMGVKVDVYVEKA